MTQADLTRNLGMGAWNRPKAPAPKKAKPTKPKPKPTKPKPKPVYIKGAGELGARPAAPKNIDPKAITTTAIQQGNRLSDAQQAEYSQLYGTLAGQQRGEIDRIAAGLNNQYTQQAMGALGTSMDSAGTMERMASEELALGRSLSPEAMREATQSARGAFAARGLGTSLGSAAAELLNRDRYASQREQQRRTFAGTLMDTAGQMRQRGAALYGELDPYQRALTPGLSLGQTAQQMGLNTTGNNFGNTLQLGANAASFNTNMAGDLFTNWQNNAAAIKGANTTAQATRDASRRTTGDYIIGGLQALNPFG